MLLGTHTPRLDEKGRVIVPAKFRNEFAAGLVLTRGQERCVYVFTEAGFSAQTEKIRQAPLTSKVGRDYLRVFLSGASAEALDAQHRVTIPTMLREYAGLERDLVVIGMGDRAEIWNPETWEAYYAEQEEKFSSTDEEVIPGLF